MTSLLYPLFDALHLPGLKTYFWTVVAATLFWQALYSGVFLLYESIKPAFYQKLSFVKKLDWAMHRIKFLFLCLELCLNRLQMLPFPMRSSVLGSPCQW